jgi:hypothetical protein
MDTIQQILGEFDSNFPATTSTVDEEVLLGMLTTLGIAIATVVLFIILTVYVYNSLTLFKTAERLGHPTPWLAWIPFARIYLQLELGNMNPLFLILYVSPFLIGALSALPYIGSLFTFLGTGVSTAIVVVNVITFMNISKRRGYDKELGLMIITPFTGWILRGILAWGKKNSEI